jgi:hypothetical protein
MDTLPLEWAAPSSLYASIVHQKSRCTSYNRAPDCDRRANEIALAPATQSPSWSIHFANDYSPTHIVTADSAAEIVARLGDATFDFRRDVVVTGVGEPLVPAQEMRLSITRRGLLFSGESAGTSLVLLPQQFYNCPRSSDQTVRIVRANLTSAALLFSGKVEPDISLGYGLFSPACRRDDLADLKRLMLSFPTILIRASTTRRASRPASMRPSWLSSNCRTSGLGTAT